MPKAHSKIVSSPRRQMLTIAGRFMFQYLILLFMLIIITLTPEPAIADNKSFLIGQAAIPYLGSTHVMFNLKKSECGYAVNNNVTYDVTATKNSILKILRSNDKASIKQFLKSNDYKTIVQQSENIVNEMLSQLKDSKKDKKTTCGIIVGALHNTYFMSLNKWKQAVLQYQK